MIIYLAAPYSHSDPKVRDSRFNAVNKKAAELMEKGHIVFSPISHSHSISKYVKNIDACDNEFWLNQDFPFLDICDEMWVLKLDGWKKSDGIKKEISYAEYSGKPIRYIS